MKNIILPAVAAITGFALGFLRWATASPHSAPMTVPAPLAEEPATSVGYEALSEFLADGNFRQFAKLAAMMEKLDSQKLAAVLDRLASRRSGEADYLLPAIVAQWTRRDPDAAFAWMQPRLLRLSRGAFFFSFNNSDSDTALVRAWAENDPNRAMDYARTIPRTELAGRLLRDALYAFKGKSDAEKFELLKAFPDGSARNNTLTSIFSSWRQSDPAAALVAASALPPSPARESLLAEALAGLGRKDRDAAFAKLRELNIRDVRLEIVLAYGAASKDPVEAAKWLENQREELPPTVAATIACQWAKKDPAAAFAWSVSHGIPLDKMESDFAQASNSSVLSSSWQFEFESPLSAAFNAKPAETLRLVAKLPPGEERDRFFNQLAVSNQSSERTLTELKSVFPTLPIEAQLILVRRILRGENADTSFVSTLTGEVRAEALRTLGASKGPEHPTPPGPDRDLQLDGYAYGTARVNPSKALDATMQISNPELRQRSFDDVMWSISRGTIPLPGGTSYSEPSDVISKAREWLENANVPEQWKARWSPVLKRK